MWTVLLIGAALLPAQQTTEAAPEIAAPPASPPDRWCLMKQLQGTWPGWLLDGNRMQILGWTDASVTASTAAHEQLPMGFNYKADQFLLQQNWLRFERTVDQSATTPTFGFRSDTILPGTDYRFTLARGLFDSQLHDHLDQPATYGIDPVQAYAEAYFPQVVKGLDVKLGRFFAQFGVESIDATQNALGSRAYTFIYDPFTHTGLLTTLKLTDAWSVQNGLVTGSDIAIHPAATPTYIGSVKWAASDNRDSVLFSVILGGGRFNESRQFNNPEIFDLVYTHRFDSRLNYSLETLYGFQYNVPETGFANWFGILNYLTFDFTPRLAGTTRLEFFDDPQGQRTGSNGLYVALTAGLTYKPIKQLWLRPELRCDCNPDSRPFADKHGVGTACMDVIVRW
jgi:Putative beta-barrel porin-2, OmpL-like. bbp2